MSKGAAAPLPNRSSMQGHAPLPNRVLRLVSLDDPHCEELRAAAVGMAQCGPGTRHLAFVSHATHLQRCLGQIREAGETVLVPARLVQDGAVWLLDAGGRATRRRVTVGSRQGDLVEVTAGLNLSDKLVDVGRERLGEGTRARIARGSE